MSIYIIKSCPICPTDDHLIPLVSPTWAELIVRWCAWILNLARRCLPPVKILECEWNQLCAPLTCHIPLRHVWLDCSQQWVFRRWSGGPGGKSNPREHQRLWIIYSRPTGSDFCWAHTGARPSGVQHRDVYSRLSDRGDTLRWWTNTGRWQRRHPLSHH